ncbi:hypothetical protein [Microcoleus sp. CAWBG58]|uniref:hypothetical protein n=1 Tax=Microcoleus sp. CAWBG58 TaxID=2841651 RepID=UPI0025E58263|nr:hypothetical protein [Microcoleus sp. CAWBG58]
MVASIQLEWRIACSKLASRSGDLLKKSAVGTVLWSDRCQSHCRNRKKQFTANFSLYYYSSTIQEAFNRRGEHRAIATFSRLVGKSDCDSHLSLKIK